MQQKKTRRGREYLNDFRRDVNGSYLYQGSYRRYTGSMPYAKLRGLLWALCCIIVGIVTALLTELTTNAVVVAAFIPVLAGVGEAIGVSPFATRGWH